MRIYVAGPYTANNARDVTMNINAAIEASCKLIAKGHSPFIPHLCHYIWTHPAGDFHYEDWMRIDFDFLEVCEGFLLIAPSPGANKELKRAKELGLKIWYNADEVPENG